MKALVVVFIVALCVLHHDIWWWESPGPINANTPEGDRFRGLVFDFMPIGLAWHVGISFAAAAVWWIAARFCWPTQLDDPEQAADQQPTEQVGNS